MRLRVLTETARAVATGVTNLALGVRRIAHALARARDPAPDFTLPASDGRDYRLSEFSAASTSSLPRFPKAFTGGCIDRVSIARGTASPRDRPTVQFFAASVDSVEMNAEFAGARP
jgi:peroxiredoxin